jgi:hypothetical protein
LRQSAVSTKQKIRRIMRSGFRESRNIFARQCHCFGETQVTRCATPARNIEMRFPETVTIEALPDDCIADSHSRSARLNMAAAAITNQDAVGDVPPRRGAVMSMVRESPVSVARPNTRRP